jgi:hypothetical protein
MNHSRLGLLGLIGRIATLVRHLGDVPAAEADFELNTESTSSRVDNHASIAILFDFGLSHAEEYVMASEKPEGPLSFEVPTQHADAIKKLAGGRQVRLMGKVQGNRFRVDFVACNSAFVACNAAFTACNSPFVKEK